MPEGHNGNDDDDDNGEGIIIKSTLNGKGINYKIYPKTNIFSVWYAIILGLSSCFIGITSSP